MIGSCRVHGPVKALVAEGGARAVAFPFNTYTHSPQDALQYLRFCLGRLILPPPLEPLVFGKAGMRYPALGFMQLVAGLDLIIAEVSSQTRLSAAGFEVQQNYFATNFVRPGGKPMLDWWRSVVRNDIARTAETAELIENGVADALWQQEVVSTAQLDEIDDEAFARAMTELVASHSARWLSFPISVSIRTSQWRLASETSGCLTVSRRRPVSGTSIRVRTLLKPERRPP